VDWSEIERLRREGVPERALAKLARDHGLQLPHAPAIRAAGTPAPGVQQWTVYCQACELEQGVPVGQCLHGAWSAPALLLNPEPVRWAVSEALSAMERAAA
jgi:hypothetical protein